MTGLIHNVSGLDCTRWPSATEVLDSLWRGGSAAMLRRDQLVQVREGFLADLTMLDLHSLAFTPLNDIRGQLVYCESGDSVQVTMVDGRVVYDHGRLTTLDEHALLAEARELFALKQPSIAAARLAAKELIPGYLAVVRQAAEADLGMTRWIGNQ
jgi:5-methylthioadenosine/S-adenosylhomocysteine deaminase